MQQERKDLKREYAKFHDSMKEERQEMQNKLEDLIKQRDSSAAVDAMKKAFETLQKKYEILQKDYEHLKQEKEAKQSPKKRTKTNGNGNGGGGKGKGNGEDRNGGSGGSSRGGRGGRSTSSTSSSSTSLAAEPPSKKRKTTTTNVEKRQGKRGAVAAAVEMAGTVHATLPTHRVANSVNDDMYFNSKFVQSHIIHALLLNYGWSIREAKSRNRSGVMYEYSTGSDCTNNRFVFSDKFRADIVKWAKNNASYVYEEAAKEANVWVYWKQEDAYYACTIKDVIVKTTEGIEKTTPEKLSKWNVRFHSDASSSKDIIDSEINSFDYSRNTVINAIPIFTYEILEDLIRSKLSLNV